MLNQFNAISPAYDVLAKLVFNDQINQSQKYFLPQIPTNGRILILGGGSGWILEQVKNVRPQSEIWYIEASSTMMVRTQKRVGDSDTVHLIHGTERDIPSGLSFDVIITNFYFDVFTEEELIPVVDCIQRAMSTKSIWLFTDFVSNKHWHKMLLIFMYTFFKLVCNIKANRLPEWHEAISRLNFVKRDRRLFFHGFISSTFYERNSSTSLKAL